MTNYENCEHAKITNDWHKCDNYHHPLQLHIWIQRIQMKSIGLHRYTYMDINIIRYAWKKKITFEIGMSAFILIHIIHIYFFYIHKSTITVD